MQILHAADLHIDSPLRGLSRYEGAPVEDLRLATRGALKNLVSLALELPVDAVLLAGDVYDGDWRDFQTGLFFVSQMSELLRADIPVYMVSGNHDAQNRTMRSLQMPDNVHVLATDKPETERNEEVGISVHGQGFSRWDLTDNLAAAYPQRDEGLFNIGLLHTALDGGNPEHKRYAPCTLADLESKGYDYWALGHIHARKVVRNDPWIVYPGNIQGRHARETGPKGCSVVTVGGNDLQVRSVEHHDLDTARWENIVVDVSGVEDTDQVLSRAQEQFQNFPTDRLHAVRVTLTGRTSINSTLWGKRDQLLHELRAAAGHYTHLWMEKLKIRTFTEYVAESGSGGVIADLRRTITGLGADPDRLSAMLKESPLLGVIPPEIKGRDGIDLDDPAWAKRVSEEAFQLVESLLQEIR
ncbi:DNA repair exonuclease [Microbispora hainanensis]|uniref:metallophosphoesterase family protein n=1 Tax=Microbispora hainanensis TaxID=568844 RepID=UPI0033CAB0B3